MSRLPIQLDRRAARLASDRRAGTFARRKARTLQRAYLRKHWWRLLLVYLLTLGAAISPTLLFVDNQLLAGYAIGTAATGIAAALLIAMIIQTGTGPTMAGEWAELWTAQALRPLSSAGYHLINHVQVDDYGDVDHVLLGPQGIYLIETKWSATAWELTNPVLQGAVRRMHFKAREVRRQLSDLPPAAVVPVVALWGQAAAAASTGTGVHKLKDFDSNVMAGMQLERWLLGRGRGALTPELTERARAHFVSLAHEGDLAEAPVPVSMERMFWSAVAVIAAGLVSFLAPMYLAKINTFSSLTGCLVVLVAGTLARRRAAALGTAAVTGGLLALGVCAVALLWPTPQ